MKRVIFALLCSRQSRLLRRKDRVLMRSRHRRISHEKKSDAVQPAARNEGCDISKHENEASAPASAKKDTGDAIYKSKILSYRSVNDLKEKIRTKTRLAILKENVLSTIAGADAKLVHQNDMGVLRCLRRLFTALMAHRCSVASI